MNYFDPLLQFFEMRSWPVNLAAPRATPELFVIDFGERLELLDDVVFSDFSQLIVAMKASGKRSNQAEKIKAADHFDCLLVGVL